jgi:hypothetical protein
MGIIKYNIDFTNNEHSLHLEWWMRVIPAAAHEPQMHSHPDHMWPSCMPVTARPPPFSVLEPALAEKQPSWVHTCCACNKGTTRIQ